MAPPWTCSGSACQCVPTKPPRWRVCMLMAAGPTALRSIAVYRGSHWQIGLAFPKGAYAQVRARGLGVVRQTVGSVIPWLDDRLGMLRDWSQTSLLSVESSRVRRWYRPGLLVIGDAAHVMSPAGAVGINAAVADAVATARVLMEPLRRGRVSLRDLAAVQRRRESHIRIAQWFQATLEQEIWAAGQARHMTWSAHLVATVPPLRELRNRVFVYSGLWPEHVAATATASTFEVGHEPRPEQCVAR
jgi:2-polyprenyl-6-methoxyphenol hydroxylase-like FAD-dependent oxidoreductase